MWELELEEMKRAALLAEKKILEVYESSFDVEFKDDDSPVTEADKEADKIIREYLHGKFPNHAFLTEESVDTKERLEAEWIFIIDPVDGTKEFVNRNGEFTTNIALCHNHEIVDDAQIKSAETAEERRRFAGIPDFVEGNVSRRAGTHPEFGIDEHGQHTGQQESPPNPVAAQAVATDDFREEVGAVRAGRSRNH